MGVVGEVILTFHDDGRVTNSAFTAGEAAEHSRAVRNVQGAMPDAAVVDDPWQTQQPAAPVTPPPVPSCVHGPLKAVPGGFSQAKQKAYAAFWACPAPRGQQCRLDAKTLPPVPAQ